MKAVDPIAVRFAARMAERREGLDSLATRMIDELLVVGASSAPDRVERVRELALAIDALARVPDALPKVRYRLAPSERDALMEGRLPTELSPESRDLLVSMLRA